MAFTRENGIQWAKDRLGTRIHSGTFYGAQCMDFIIAFCDDNFGWRPRGNASDLPFNRLPLGWQLITYSPNTLPKPGDIIIWAGASAAPVLGHSDGHVGIVISVEPTIFTSVDQNWANPNPAAGSPAMLVSHNYQGVWGMLRPPYFVLTAPKLIQATNAIQSGDHVVLTPDAQSDANGQPFSLHDFSCTFAVLTRVNHTQLIIQPPDCFQERIVTEQDVWLMPRNSLDFGDVVTISETASTWANGHFLDHQAKHATFSVRFREGNRVFISNGRQRGFINDNDVISLHRGFDPAPSAGKCVLAPHARTSVTGAPFTFHEFTIKYVIVKKMQYNHVVIQHDSGGRQLTVQQNDLWEAPENNVRFRDQVRLSQRAIHWENGTPLSENEKIAIYSVRKRRGCHLLIRAGNAGGMITESLLVKCVP